MVAGKYNPSTYTLLPRYRESSDEHEQEHEKSPERWLPAGHSRRMFDFLTARPGTQSSLTVSKVGNTHTFVFLSASQSLGIRLSPGHQTGLLPAIPPSSHSPTVCCCCRMGCNSRRCGLLQVPETLPEVRIPLSLPTSPKGREIRWIALKITGKGRNSTVLAFKPDQRKSCSQLLRRAFEPLSLEGRHAVRFQHSSRRMQCDHKPMMWRKRP